MAERTKRKTLEYDWDPQKWVIVHNKTANNILLDLPTGYFRLDAGRSFRMTQDIVGFPQVKQLIEAGQLEVSQR